MRLSEAKIKEAILHPDKSVRDEALSYFTESFDLDAGVMPLAIQAIETFGREDAFRGVYSLADVPQTEATVEWLIRELNREQGSTIPDEDYAAALSRVLCKADPKLLLPRADEIAKSPGFSPSCLAELRGRLERMTWDAEQCWKDLNELAEIGASGRSSDPRLERAQWTIAALARCSDLQADRVLDLLSQKITDFEKNPMVWLEEYSVILAGEMRLDRAIPLLVAKLREDGDYLLEHSVDALGKIGTDAATEAITANWSAESWDYRLFATSALEKVHSDTTVRKCLQLLPNEKEADIQTKLADALLAQFDDEAIEPVREMVRTQSYDSSMTDLSSRLVAVSTVLGVTFPEFATWKRRAEEKRIRLERRMKEFDRAVRSPQSLASPASAASPKTKPKLPSPVRLAPVVAEKTKVGRNELCPCGSGKKYKVCCLRK